MAVLERDRDSIEAPQHTPVRDSVVETAWQESKWFLLASVLSFFTWLLHSYGVRNLITAATHLVTKYGSR